MNQEWGYVAPKKQNDKEEMPVAIRKTPAPVVNLNKQIYAIEIYYLDYILEGCYKMLKLPKTDPVFESKTSIMNGARAGCSDETLRAATLLIVDLIELKNAFREKPGEKRTILVFMPGLMEIF